MLLIFNIHRSVGIGSRVDHMSRCVVDHMCRCVVDNVSRCVDYQSRSG